MYMYGWVTSPFIWNYHSIVIAYIPIQNKDFKVWEKNEIWRIKKKERKEFWVKVTNSWGNQRNSTGKITLTHSWRTRRKVYQCSYSTNTNNFNFFWDFFSLKLILKLGNFSLELFKWWHIFVSWKQPWISFN